jgi:putative DNA primase/helicase
MTEHTKREALPPINFAALAEALLGRADQLVKNWLPGGKLTNGEYLVHSVWRSEKTPSLSVRVSGERAGRWSDFGGEDRGNDLISLYAAIHSMDMGKAAVELARNYGLEDVANVRRARTDGSGSQAEPERVAPTPPPPLLPEQKPPRADEGWRTNMPVPSTAPAPTFKHKYREPEEIEHTAEYRADGQLLGYVVRFRTSTGGKETLPYTWCTSARDGASRWHWKQWDDPRPLYFPGGRSPREAGIVTVVLVEGEKKAGILQALLDATAPGVYLVASWPGGCKAWNKALWDWLAGCTVLLWPDCDGKRELLTKKERDSVAAQATEQLKAIGGQVTQDDLARVIDTALQIAQTSKPLLPAYKQGGMAAMLGIGALLQGTHGCNVQLLPIPEPLEVPDGWDCADAIQTDGWDGERVLAFFGRAQPLPADADAPAAAGGGGSGGKDGGGKKNDGPAGAGDEKDAKPAKDLPWWLAPYWDAEKGRWYTSRKLVIAALKHDPLLDGVLGLNELSNNIDARLPWPWPHGKAGPLTGSTDLLLGQYLTDTYGLPSIARAALIEAIETVAHANRFHPVVEHLRGLKWDGTPRLDKWLIHVIGETPESITAHYKRDGVGARVVEYLTLVGRYIVLGMVNRVMEPGCKFDYCPVLEGPGGLGKSTFAEVLATPQYFSDTHFDVARGKDGQEQVQGLWIYEIAELANFGKAEIALIKAFISAKVDRYRPSYGRTVESYPRQCVLLGTTNEKTYLRDRTGNRRFWPIPVRNRINIPWLRKWREQLLAEAYQLYLQGEAFTPAPDVEERLFVPMQESRLVETAVVSEMTHVLTRTPSDSGMSAVVNNLTNFVTISQLVVALGVDAAKSSPALEGQIRAWLDHEGWEREKKQVNGVRAWGYVRPDNWPPIEAPDPAPVASAAGTHQPVDGDDDHAPF